MCICHPYYMLIYARKTVVFWYIWAYYKCDQLVRIIIVKYSIIH